MNKQEGLVTAATDDKATIVIIRESACGGNCSMCGGSCGGAYQMEIRNTQNLCVGDRVYLCANTAGVLLLAFISYIVPFIPTLCVYGITNSDSLAVLSLIVFFIIGTFSGNYLAKRPFFKTRIIKREGDFSHEHL